jgi:hypothetical protein
MISVFTEGAFVETAKIGGFSAILSLKNPKIHQIRLNSVNF